MFTVTLPMTLKSIAAAAGVSHMTVSRALRNDPRVSAATHARIQEVAERLGYRPNPLVSALMTQVRSGQPSGYKPTVGFLTSFPTRDGWRRIRLYREFYEGAKMGAGRHGYALEEFWRTEPGMSDERLSRILRTRNIHGVILAPLAAPMGSVDLRWDNLCAVTLGYSIQTPDLHRVSNYQFRSMRLLLHKLRDLGYEKPGLALSRSLDDRVLHQWFGGFVVAQSMFPKRPVPLLIIPDEEWSGQRFSKWLEKHEPDVVIGQQKEPLDWIEKSGRRVGVDIGFAHLDCPSIDGYFSGLYQNGPEIGTAAADALIAKLQRNERGVPALPRTLLIEGTWVPGRTVRPRKERETPRGAAR